MQFCLIGAGRAGLVHARNLRLRIKRAELAALCDANADTLQKVGGKLEVPSLYADYREALDRPDIDAAIIVTPTFLRRDTACAAAERGKHVFLENPMAVSAAEGRPIDIPVEPSA